MEKNEIVGYELLVNDLNWVVHRPEEYQLPAKDLIDLPRKGLLALINFLIA
ncbi:hypothetical protein [Helicobacter ganmani]|uniref:hypothetical protein n=1 Tax=Helicobacter ganmani TaxID=60246 RepID=UPI003A85B4E9